MFRNNVWCGPGDGRPHEDEEMITTLRKWLKLGSDARGVTAIEYGLIAAFMAAVIVIVMGTLGGGLKNVFNSISGELSNPTSGSSTPAG